MYLVYAWVGSVGGYSSINIQIFYLTYLNFKKYLYLKVNKGFDSYPRVVFSIPSFTACFAIYLIYVSSIGIDFITSSIANYRHSDKKLVNLTFF